MTYAANFQPSRATIKPYFDALVPAYRTYCTTVSVRSMALAIETCAYVSWLCDATKPANVCDLGSGFSSYVLRRYADQADHPVNVVSVDDDDGWLDKTATFCDQNVETLGEFLSGVEWLELDGFDVVVHDYAAGPLREEYADLAATRLSGTGAVVFDDAQNPGHHHRFAEVCERHGLTLLDIYHQTVDEIGRYAAIGVGL